MTRFLATYASLCLMAHHGHSIYPDYIEDDTRLPTPVRIPQHEDGCASIDLRLSPIQS